VERLKGLINKK
jgi:hypothetical protein